MDVPHVRQQYSWDCGLACAAALLAAVPNRTACSRDGEDVLTTLHANPESLPVAASSLWTIDVLSLLHARGVCGVMTTTLAAPNPDHARHAFYTVGEDFDNVAARVEAAFGAARAAGACIIERSVPLAEIRATLAARHAVYVCLLDRRRVACTRCGSGGATGEAPGGYQGHYVVLTDARDGLIEVMDPAADERRCVFLETDLDRARLADGTDEDLIEFRISVSPGGSGGRYYERHDNVQNNSVANLK